MATYNYTNSVTWTTSTAKITVKPYCRDHQCRTHATVSATWVCTCGETQTRPYCDKHFDDLLRRKRTHACLAEDNHIRYNGHTRL